MSEFYVKMTDNFLSNWGQAENKTSIYIIKCDKLEEAETVLQNAKHRKDMSKPSIVTTLPSFNKEKYHISITSKEDGARNWFIKDFFKSKKNAIKANVYKTKKAMRKSLQPKFLIPEF